MPVLTAGDVRSDALDKEASKSSDLDTHPFTCSICLEFNVEPISLSCGHTFCRTCVKMVAEPKSRKRCPCKFVV